MAEKSSDKLEQDDEVLALENIFSGNEDLAYKILARIEATDGISAWTGCVEVHPSLSGPLGLVVARKDDAVTERVEHLPSLKLYFTFPPNYPSVSPPTFTLACEWLNRTQLSSLCRELDIKFEPGCPVLFSWAMFLREEALPFLGISNAIYLKPAAGDGCELDPRAVGRHVHDPMNLLNALLDFNERKRKKVFDVGRHMCDICGETHLGKDSMEFITCRHVYCRECLRNYFKVQISEARCHALVCPDVDCDTPALPSQVRDIVGEELYKKYDRLLLASTLDRMADVCYCPRTFCQAPVLLEAAEDSSSGTTEMGRCPKCHFVFCNRCRKSYHGLAPCKLLNEEKRKLFEMYVNASPQVKAELEKKYGSRQIQNLVAELNSENWLDENSKLCPHCNARIEKTGGCNKMSCWKCGSWFCWLCQAILSKDNPYAHFSSTAVACYNQLFAGADQEMDDDEMLEFVDDLEEDIEEGVVYGF